MDYFDAIVIGAGVIGLATAAELSQNGLSVLVVDKNTHFGEETSSRNSEVIHAGLYYPKNSLKAELCLAGKQYLYQYCLSRQIEHRQLGKLLVAQNDNEAQKLADIKCQAQQNGVEDLIWFTADKIKRTCSELRATEALLSPSTGIINSHQFMQSLVADLEKKQGQLVLQTKMISAESANNGFKVVFDSQQQKISLKCRYLVNTAGLHSAKVAKHIDGLADKFIPAMYWCRGHYFAYQGKSPFNQLIYPVPQTQGLGIHATLDMAGQLKFGPDTEYIDELNYQVSAQLHKKFVSAIKQYWPNINAEKLVPSYSGIRPKLQPASGGFADFDIQCQQKHGVKGLVNLFGIESPGLTASLAIAKKVVAQLFI